VSCYAGRTDSCGVTCGTSRLSEEAGGEVFIPPCLTDACRPTCLEVPLALTCASGRLLHIRRADALVTQQNPWRRTRRSALCVACRTGSAACTALIGRLIPVFSYIGAPAGRCADTATLCCNDFTIWAVTPFTFTRPLVQLRVNCTPCSLVRRRPTAGISSRVTRLAQGGRQIHPAGAATKPIRLKHKGIRTGRTDSCRLTPCAKQGTCLARLGSILIRP
jgi:hypothetical protein